MYLDPGSWSLALQAIIGVAVAIPVLIGIYWGGVKVFFSRKRTNDRKGD